MAQIIMTKEFLGGLGEHYFKHFSFQNSFGYLRLEEIHGKLPSQVLDFKFKFKRIPIIIPPSLIDEITRISKPTLVNGTRSFVFDFLTCKLSQGDSTEKPNPRDPHAFCWVEIKAGSGHLSHHQFQVKQTCKMRFGIFKIRNVMSSPSDVEIDWEFDSRRFS